MTRTSFYLLALTLFLLAAPINAFAEAEVSGRYLQKNNGKVSLQLNVSSSAPQSLILEQYLPPGTRIMSSSPKAIQADSSSGTVKWLFRRLPQGATTVTLTVSPASAASTAQGVIRYRPSGKGDMIESRIHE